MPRHAQGRPPTTPAATAQQEQEQLLLQAFETLDPDETGYVPADEVRALRPGFTHWPLPGSQAG